MGARDQFTAGQRDSDAASREYAFHSHDFDRVRKLIYSRAGINLNESKQNMVYSRLARRLRSLGIDSFSAYLDQLERDCAFNAAEAQQFINALTTNLTSFFREPHHFPILADFLAAQAARAPARIWCSAASTGEEPYSIAMTMVESLGDAAGARLLATDIDTEVLAAAARGVYRLEAAQGCGEARLRRFFLRGKGTNAGSVRVKPELSKRVEFASLNLLADTWPQIGAFARELDVIFCRNVMIYFDKPTQRVILGKMARLLRPGGLLVVGHSENFSDCRDWFTLKGKTVYERTGA
jgi:chemotaxis protein methyltransferase CheR